MPATTGGEVVAAVVGTGVPGDPAGDGARGMGLEVSPWGIPQRWVGEGGLDHDPSGDSPSARGARVMGMPSVIDCASMRRRVKEVNPADVGGCRRCEGWPGPAAGGSPNHSGRVLAGTRLRYEIHGPPPSSVMPSLDRAVTGSPMGSASVKDEPT